jgi:hypothetical protein
MVAGLTVLAAGPGCLAGQERPAYTLDQLVILVESREFSDEGILYLARESCLAFRLDSEAAERLRAARATDELITGLRTACVREARSGVSGKSVGTAVALGVVVPGGAEFYAGNTEKGIVVFLGAAAALAAGYFIASEDVVSESYRLNAPPECVGATCTYGEVEGTQEVETTRQLAIGAAVAGAFWLYGLIDGVASVKAAAAGSARASAGGRPSLELVPCEGLVAWREGRAAVTLVRIRT